MRSLTRTTVLAAGLALGLAAPATAGPVAPAAFSAQDVQPAAEHGPAPTKDSVGVDGPYEVASKKLEAAPDADFYGGTVFHPSNGAEGETFGGVVTMPGFTEPGSAMEFVAKRLASHGFVVLMAEAPTVMSQPQARGKAALGAQKALAADADMAPLLDAERTALVGHSMGGGGVLYAAQESEQDAVVPIHPWAQEGFKGVSEPSLTIAGGIDNVAPAGEYAVPIHESIGSETKGLFTDLAGTHWAGLVDNKVIQGRILSFLKVHVDGDQRYEQFVCAPAEQGFVYRSPC
ncbi:dienelactone hydrolase family protein [Kytococcus sp. Marseille-QA3725]